MIEEQAVVGGEAAMARALARWAEALSTAKELKSRLLLPEPGDLRPAIARLEREVRLAAEAPLPGVGEGAELRQSLRQVLREFAETTQEIGLVADARAKTAQGVLRLFQRPDLPPGSMLDV
jgi:hypothetical protein